ncbi:MAG: flagellar FlbD family protein [Candidatus Hydrogenedentes bacterium]|nr:flagellar FlbD family protein [Candidatus Hydrogenedentota bacterium]
MIQVTRLNGKQYVVNAELIREIEATPDTIITLVSGEKLLVLEPVADIIKAVIDYKRAIHNNLPTAATDKSDT